MNELEKIVNGAAEKLGVRFTFREETLAEKADMYVGGAKTDGKNTYFRFTYGGKAYTGVIEGATRAEKNYAALLPSYIAAFSERESGLSKESFLKKLLLGEGTPADAYKYSMKYAVKETPCFVLVIKLFKAYPDAYALLCQYGDEKEDCVVRFDDKNFAFVKSFAPSDEYASPSDYAEFLGKFLVEELGARLCIGVGSITSGFQELSVSYTRAATALKYAETFANGEGVHSYKEYTLAKLLEEVPKSRLAEFMSDISEEQMREIFDDEEMLLTAEKFLSSSLNVSETSRSLYMHRNTLLYRLDKIEKSTGLNIRMFPDAVTFRVLTILYKLLKK